MLDIKEVTSADFNEIWHVFKDVIQDEDTYPYPADITIEDARALWFSPGARVYHAYIDGVPMATRYITPNKVGLGSHICNTGVMIDKAYRGQGYGKILNDFAISKAKELGYKAIQLNLVVVTNEASIRICEKNGFIVIGTIPEAFFYKRERYVDALIMHKTL